MIERLLLTPREAAYRLAISTRHLWSISAPRGPIPVVRIGRRVFYRPKDLEHFVAQLAEQSLQAGEKHEHAGSADDEQST